MTSHAHIPTVNLQQYQQGNPKEKAEFVKVFGDGIKEFGFVTVEGHGVDQNLIRRTYKDVEALFKLPDEAKKRYQIPGGGGQRGYTPFGNEHAKNRTVGDLKEFWHVGRELPKGHRLQTRYGPNVWPEEVATFRQNAIDLFHALDRSAAVMLEALADYFGIARDRFANMAVDGNSVLRLIHYPPLREKFVPGGVRAAEHEDINLITLLCEGTASGLEILTRDGKWLPIDTLQGQIVVDSGDMLSRVTNEVIPATTHRVVNPKEADLERYSLPFFVHPYPECDLTPLPETGEAKFPPITADEFLQQRLREIGLIK